MSDDTMPPKPGTRRDTAAEAVLNALPLPVLTIGRRRADPPRQPRRGSLLRLFARLMQRRRLRDIIPFASPDHRPRGRGAPPRRQRQRVPGRADAAPRSGWSAASTSSRRPLGDDGDAVVMMLQERTIADKMNRQLTHRGAARSMVALGAMLAHEIKNPLAGIRGAAQLLESTGAEEDRMLTRLICDESDRIVKHRRAHGAVRRRAALRSRRRQRPRGARSGEALGPERVRPAYPLRRDLRPVAAAGARQPRPVDPGDPQPREERRRGDRAGRSRRRNHPVDRFPHRPAPAGAGLARAGQPADRGRRSATTARASRPTCCPTCSTRSSPPRRRGPASVLHWSPRSSAITVASSSAIPPRAARRSASFCRCRAPGTGANRRSIRDVDLQIRPPSEV